MNDYQQRRISIHEAGHALVAHHEGFQTEGVTVHLKGGSATCNPRLPNAALTEYASSRLCVLLAGAMAQCIVLDPENQDCLRDACSREDAANDWLKAQEIITLVAHHRTRGLVQDEDEMQRVVDGIVDEHSRRTMAILEVNRRVLDETANLVRRRFAELFAFSPDDIDAPNELHVTATRLATVFEGVQQVPVSPPQKGYLPTLSAASTPRDTA